MAFYVAKGLQVAGLVGMPVALYAGFSQDAGMMRELLLASVAVVMFYAGRMLETR